MDSLLPAGQIWPSKNFYASPVNWRLLEKFLQFGILWKELIPSQQHYTVCSIMIYKSINCDVVEFY